MAKSQKQRVTLEAISAELRTAADKFLSRVAKGHAGETLYGFLFEISCEGFSAHGAAATEEGLTRFAEQWVAEEGGKLEKWKAEFRWGCTEDAWYQQLDSAFDKVNKLLGKAEQQELYEMYDGTLQGLCIDVLKEMDAAGTFGTGKERERLVVGLCYIGGDNTESEFLGWAKQVNSPTVMKRLRKEFRA